MRKRGMLTPAMILMATLLSVGCTAGGTQEVAEAAVQAESAVGENTDENAETKALQSEEKSTLVLTRPKDLRDMNSHTISSPMYAQDWVYDGLTASVDGKVVPKLAENWEISEDRKIYTFYLRKNMKFSDGSDPNAELVKENVQDMIDNRDGYSFLQYLEEIDTMDTPDDATLIMNLKNPYNSPLSDMSFNGPLTVAGRAAFPESGNIYKDGIKKLVGTGMWTVKEYTQDRYTIFERNEYYWGEKPSFKYVRIKVIPDMDTVISALKAGEIDMYIDVNDGSSVDAYYELGKLGFGTQIAEGMQVTSLSLNTASGMLGDVSVCQVSEYTTDNTVIPGYVHGSLQKPASSYFADGVTFTQAGTDGYPYQLGKTAETSELAGWSLESGNDYRMEDGITLEMDMLHGTVLKNGKSTGSVLRKQYKKMGVKLDIYEENPQVFRKKQKRGDPDTILYSSQDGSYESFATLATMRNDGNKFSTVQKGMDNKAYLSYIFPSPRDIIL